MFLRPKAIVSVKIGLHLGECFFHFAFGPYLIEVGTSYVIRLQVLYCVIGESQPWSGVGNWP